MMSTLGDTMAEALKRYWITGLTTLLLGTGSVLAVSAFTPGPQAQTTFAVAPLPVAVTRPEVVQIAAEQAKIQVDAAKADQRDRDLATSDLLKRMDLKLDTVLDGQAQQHSDIAVLKATARRTR